MCRKLWKLNWKSPCRFIKKKNKTLSKFFHPWLYCACQVNPLLKSVGACLVSMEIGFGPSAVNPLLQRILLIRSDSFRHRTCDLFEKNPFPYLVLLKIYYLKNSITNYLMKYNWKVPSSFFFKCSLFLSAQLLLLKKKKSEVYNNASNYVLWDFYCLAIYYKCFCGWYKVFEQVFKLVRNVLNIGDCYYRLCFMIYGWFIDIKTKSKRSMALTAIFLW